LNGLFELKDTFKLLFMCWEYVSIPYLGLYEKGVCIKKHVLVTWTKITTSSTKRRLEIKKNYCLKESQGLTSTTVNNIIIYKSKKTYFKYKWENYFHANICVALPVLKTRLQKPFGKSIG